MVLFGDFLVFFFSVKRILGSPHRWKRKPWENRFVAQV
jgi:hypothetical protein